MTEQQRTVARSERRREQRFTIQAPGTVVLEGREVRTFTRDVSPGGVYLIMAADEPAPAVEDAVDLTITIPPSLCRSKPCIVSSRGRTVRMEYTESGEIGLAVEIIDFVIHHAVSPRSAPL